MSLQTRSGPSKTSGNNRLLMFFFCWSILVMVALTTGFVSSKSMFITPRPTMRFCYQPGDQLAQQSAPISSQCVYCNRNMFDYTLLQCTGISAVTQYINTTQAFCIISQCLEQIRSQVPVLLG